MRWMSATNPSGHAGNAGKSPTMDGSTVVAMPAMLSCTGDARTQVFSSCNPILLCSSLFHSEHTKLDHSGFALKNFTAIQATSSSISLSHYADSLCPSYWASYAISPPFLAYAPQSCLLHSRRLPIGVHTTLGAILSLLTTSSVLSCSRHTARPFW